MEKILIEKIDEITDLIKNLKWNELRDEDMIISITKLRIILEDMFGIIKIQKKKGGTGDLNLPFVLKD